MGFTKKNFRFSPFSLILGELSRNTKYSEKIIYLFNCLRKMNFWGISTGFFATLYAHEENPNSKIIVSGIGMVGGHQFYKSERSKKYDYFPRARVDRFLVKYLNKNLKKKYIP